MKSEKKKEKRKKKMKKKTQRPLYTQKLCNTNLHILSEATMTISIGHLERRRVYSYVRKGGGEVVGRRGYTEGEFRGRQRRWNKGGRKERERERGNSGVGNRARGMGKNMGGEAEYGGCADDERGSVREKMGGS